MSACVSAASIKNRRSRANIKQEAPRPGTNLRRLYDLLMENRGRCVEFPVSEFRRSNLLKVMLTDNYGLDIRCFGTGRKSHKSVWLLAGEWHGKVYVDYVAALTSPAEIADTTAATK
jgi:hypothetical protein